MFRYLNKKCKIYNSLNFLKDYKLYFSSTESENKKSNYKEIIIESEKNKNVKDKILHLSNDAINKMKEINLKYKNSKALKICVEAGGCSGFKYSFSLIDKNQIKEKDVIVYDKECVITIDKEAVEILRNSKIHYTSNLISKKFTIENIQNVSSKCSCGNSFDINL
ncbi:iron-sulfur assembly protein, putative [Plasmodium gallinaceum]|uniref:Iron-sulfur assembly protein, putative n=2 Tax=Plasmodium gallinaceum TaxID=5849 RepID=A0A1J1GSB7_PLAGA|nr:iron-sulfur assembly protein, putative [Plasmodium gallinaceum]CRG95403.1 iron-sulfur assembly protein, putative [Plasmodium gallinaceum]